MISQVTSVKHYIETLPERFQADASKGVHAIFQFELSGDEGTTFHVSVDDGTMKVADGLAPSPTTTIKMNAVDYVKMVNGKLSGTMAFMKGLLKVTGNLMLAQKMQTIFPPAK
jgi:putative sterol carrier protein